MPKSHLTYLTIKKNSHYEQVIRKSRFIASLAKTTSLKESTAFLTHVKAAYPDATHHTFAYILGSKSDEVKVSDNGEPTRTAGEPELKVLQQLQVTNVTAVVTRYFGGIKLGAGGLIRAYASSVSHAIQTVGLVKVVWQQAIRFKIDYHELGRITHYLEQQHWPIANREFGSDVQLTLYLTPEDQKKCESDLIDLLSGNVTFTTGNGRYHEIPIEIKRQE